MKVNKPFAAHFSQLKGQSAALNAKIIRKLLSGKWNIKLIFAQPLGLGGEIGHELCPSAALAHVRKLFTEAQILFGKLTEQISDDPAVVRTGGWTHIQNTRYIQKHCGDGRFRHDAHIQPRAGRTGEGSGKVRINK